jgi:kumamolisin
MTKSARKLSIWTVIICLIVAMAVAGLVYGSRQAPATLEQGSGEAGRKVFTTSVIPLPEEATVPTGGRLVAKANLEAVATKKLSFTINLAIPEDARKELESRVAKGEIISKEEMDERYSPKADDIAKLAKWLENPDQGLQVTGQSKDRTSIYVLGTVPKIEKALKVQFVRVIEGGVTYTAARNAPSLPNDVSDSVSGIVGLQPFLKAQKRFIKVPLVRGSRARGRPDRLSTGQPQPPVTESADLPNVPPYIVPEILKAYNADGLGLTGKEQTVAILIDTFPNDTDNKAFWKRCGLTTTPKVELVNVNSAPLDPASGEESLDVQWSSGIAPGATVRVYASGTLGWDDLNKALDRISDDVDVDPKLRQLSISLGLGETYNPRAIFDAQNQRFLTLAARGVNIFVSSGDAGSRPSPDGHQTTGATQPEFGSSSPWVVGVGGTNLLLTNTGGVQQEKGWKLSGGGESHLYDRPVWQKGPGISDQGKRLVPDVALVADSDTGAFLVLNGAEIGTGGTSWSAPVWAGFCALMNEGRTTAGKERLAYLNPLIYALSDSVRAKAFRDIVLGDNIDFQAGPGHDKVTGLGVPNLKELRDALTK